MSDCFFFTRLDKAREYLQDAYQPSPVWYKWKKYILKLLCSEPLALCESRSEQIPNGVYFKCQRNRCLFFQRGDEMPSGGNLVRLEEKKKLRVKSELLRTTHPRKPRCLQFSAMGKIINIHYFSVAVIHVAYGWGRLLWRQTV